MSKPAQQTEAANGQSCLTDGLGMAKPFGIAPELRHCQAEVDEALKLGDMGKLKSIFKREGVEWLDPQMPKNGMFFGTH